MYMKALLDFKKKTIRLSMKNLEMWKFRYFLKILVVFQKRRCCWCVWQTDELPYITCIPGHVGARPRKDPCIGCIDLYQDWNTHSPLNSNRESVCKIAVPSPLNSHTVKLCVPNNQGSNDHQKTATKIHGIHGVLKIFGKWKNTFYSAKNHFLWLLNVSYCKAQTITPARQFVLWSLIWTKNMILVNSILILQSQTFSLSPFFVPDEKISSRFIFFRKKMFGPF